jgi:hypothetical protein
MFGRGKSRKFVAICLFSGEIDFFAVLAYNNTVIIC